MLLAAFIHHIHVLPFSQRPRPLQTLFLFPRRVQYFHRPKAKTRLPVHSRLSLLSTAKFLTLFPLLPFPCTLLIRLASILLRAPPTQPHYILGTLLKLLNPLYSMSTVLPLLPLLSSLLLLPTPTPSNQNWSIFYPFLSAMSCQIGCVLATLLLPSFSFYSGDAIFFGFDMSETYDNFSVLGYVIPAVWMFSLPIFALLFMIRFAILKKKKHPPN